MKLFDRLDRYLEDNDYKVTISKGIIHKNTAARKKSKLIKKLNSVNA